MTALGMLVSACVPTNGSQTDAEESADQTSTVEPTDEASTVTSVENPLRVELGVAPGDQSVPVTTINFDSVEVWCDETEGLAYLAIGDLWERGTGAGFLLSVAPDQVTLNEPLEMPLEPDTAVLFVADPDAPDGVPQEYASSQEESDGTIQFQAVPCNGSGDNLAFTVSGSLGAETNPGYESKASVQGQYAQVLTSEPAWFDDFNS